MPKTQLPDDTDKANAGAPDLDDHSVGQILGQRPDASGGGALSKAGSTTTEDQKRAHQDLKNESAGHRTAGGDL